jgi:hypothetical protein
MAKIRPSASSLSQGMTVRFDVCCQLCSRVVGQLVDDVFVHQPDCPEKPPQVGGAWRCCTCGGRLYLEPANTPLSSAADRQAARTSRPGRG